MIGTQIAQFEIQEKLGQGGMGVVYQALDTKLNRRVALKFLPPELSSNESAKARFMQEAQAASSLDHANICTIFEIGEKDDGQLFIAMAFYDGQTLKYILDGSRQSVDRLRSVGRQLASAMKRAHGAGITHRDIKPANIMVTSHDEVKLLDFGLAKLKGGLDLTVVGSTVGTAAYMSPEQMKGGAVDVASDVWSLGAVLYEMATGQKPFIVEYDQALMYAIINEDPTPVKELNPDVPDDIAGIIDACLNKNASKRPSIQNVRDAMGDESSGSRIAAPAAPAEGIPKKYVFAGLAVVVALLLSWVIWGGSSTDPEPATASSASPSFVSTKSVAVLPFRFSAGADDEAAAAFAGGMHDDLLAKLSRISDLTVISKTSVLQYENTVKPASEIAAELGVKNILEGSVQKAGNRVRISTTLIDAQSGIQLWSDQYDEELTMENIFAIQSDLSQQIATAMEAELSALSSSTSGTEVEISTEVYDLYTRAMFKRRNSRGADDIREVSEMLRRVTVMAPEYAVAHAQLSNTYFMGMNRGVWSAEEKIFDARASADRAIEIDPLLPEGLIASARASVNELEFDKAEALLQRAIEVAPGDAGAYSMFANMMYTLGRSEVALEYGLKSVALDPLDISMRQRLADIYFFTGDYEGTITESRKILDMKEDDAWSYYNIGYGMALLGRLNEAIAAFQKAVDINEGDADLVMGLAWANAMAGNDLEAVSLMLDVPDDAASLKEKAIVYGVMDDLDTAFGMLDQAFALNPGSIIIIAGDDSVPEKMRNDSRFDDLLEKLGLENR